jgi:enoyl-CoA hydratase/carnithine racemase
VTNELSFNTLLLENEGGVTTVTLNRPDKMNAFDAEMSRELTEAVLALDDDDDCRVIVITGAGRAFSAGADMAGGATPGTTSGSSQADATPQQAPSPPPLKPWKLRTPIIAAINGAAVGMGLTYPLMWDIRIAAEDAKLGFVFTRRGLVPEGNASWLLSRLIGASAALELLLTGRIFTGAEAAEMGLVTRAVPRDQVLHVAREIALDIAANTAPAAIAVTKRMFYNYLEDGDRWAARVEELDMFRWAGSMPDAAEGVKSFLEKRAPDWNDVSRDVLPEQLWPD